MGFFTILSGNFWYPPELKPRALTPMEEFSATASFSKKRDGKKLPGEENQLEAGAHGAVTVWLSQHGAPREIWAMCSRDVQESGVQETTCPLGMMCPFSFPLPMAVLLTGLGCRQ